MIGNNEAIDDFDDSDDFDDNDDFDSGDDSEDVEPGKGNVGELSVELNIDDLIAELEAESGTCAHSGNETPRKRLERLLEERRIARELDDIDEFALDMLD